MKKLFHEMISVETAFCCKCNSDLLDADIITELKSEGIYGSGPSKMRITTYDEVICAAYIVVSETVTCPSD